RLARERTDAGLPAFERNAAHRDGQLVLDPLLELDLAAEMGEREAGVYRRRRILRDAFGGEEGVKVFLGVDFMRVLAPERLGAREQRILDRLQDGADVGHELRARNALFVLRRAVAPRDEQRVFLDVARTDFHAQRHALSHPMPDLVAATLFALVDDGLHAPFGIAL